MKAVQTALLLVYDPDKTEAAHVPQNTRAFPSAKAASGRRNSTMSLSLGAFLYLLHFVPGIK